MNYLKFMNTPPRNVFQQSIFIITWLFLLILGQAANAQNRPEFQSKITTGPTIELLSVGIENFRTPTGFSTIDDSLLAFDMRNTLDDDLRFSLYFNVVNVDTSFLNNFAHGKLKLDDWIYLGAQMLISGRFEREAAGIQLTIDVTDAPRNRIVYSRDFIGDPLNYRSLIHRVAADLLYNLTGEEGVYFSKITFSCDVTGHKEIYTCDFDGFNLQQITSDASIDVLPSWSANGQNIFYTSYKNDNPDLFVFDRSLNKSRSLSSKTGLNMAAAESPDGKYLAASLSMGGDSEIYLIDMQGRIIKRLTFSQKIETSPAWSPSSRELAFTSDRTGQPQIYITDIDGLNTRRLTFQGDYNDQASWSPRGDLIAYTTRDPDGFQIYTVDVTGQVTNKLTEIGYNESPSWSPDGLHIVYASNATGSYQLTVMDYNGMNKRTLPFPGNCKTPEWSKNIK